MNEKTLNKVRIFGDNKAEWKAALLEDIDPLELPENYGGSNPKPVFNFHSVSYLIVRISE